MAVACSNVMTPSTRATAAWFGSKVARVATPLAWRNFRSRNSRCATGRPTAPWNVSNFSSTG